jgi:drug/metabolite transporter (DMT)-like permease
MTGGAQRAMTSREWSLLLLLSLLWGGSFFFVGVAVRDLPPLMIVALRVVLAAAILWALSPLTGARLPGNASALGALAVLGLVNNALPFALIAWGQTRLPSGLASILNASTPLFTVIVAHLMTSEERLTGGKVLGAAAGFAGVAFLLGPKFSTGQTGVLAAEIAVLGAALCYAFASVFGRRMRALGLAPIDIATGQATAASLFLAPLALLIDKPWTLAPPSAATMASVVAIASVSTAFAYIVYFRILAGAGATNVVLVTLLAPVTSVLLGAAFLSERLAPVHFVGFALIALGLALIDGRLASRLYRRAR